MYIYLMIKCRCIKVLRSRVDERKEIVKPNKGGKTSEEEANSQEIKMKEFYNLKMHKHQVKREEPLILCK
jgi:hypothetical protein